MNESYVGGDREYRNYLPPQPCPKCGWAGAAYAFYCDGHPSPLRGVPPMACEGTDWAGTEHLHVTCGGCHHRRIEPTLDNRRRFEESFRCSDPPSAT